jgi:choline dehydrogenase-like flavoprotein
MYNSYKYTKKKNEYFLNMGNDFTAFVDNHYRVYNVAGLRVVDSSIMPTIVSCNTNVRTVATEEKLLLT